METDNWKGKKVRCVNADAKPTLTKGMIYTVSDKYHSDHGECFRIYELNNVGFYSARFELFEEKPTSIRQVSTQSLSKPTEDQEEARLFALWTAPRPGNCGCDIPREQCDFHRPHS